VDWKSFFRSPHQLAAVTAHKSCHWKGQAKACKFMGEKLHNNGVNKGTQMMVMMKEFIPVSM